MLVINVTKPIQKQEYVIEKIKNKTQKTLKKRFDPNLVQINKKRKKINSNSNSNSENKNIIGDGFYVSQYSLNHIALIATSSCGICQSPWMYYDQQNESEIVSLTFTCSNNHIEKWSNLPQKKESIE